MNKKEVLLFDVHPGRDYGAVCPGAAALLDIVSPVREDVLEEDVN